jgi:hypothetical protein
LQSTWFVIRRGHLSIFFLKNLLHRNRILTHFLKFRNLAVTSFSLLHNFEANMKVSSKQFKRVVGPLFHSSEASKLITNSKKKLNFAFSFKKIIVLMFFFLFFIEKKIHSRHHWLGCLTQSERKKTILLYSSNWEPPLFRWLGSAVGRTKWRSGR